MVTTIVNWYNYLLNRDAFWILGALRVCFVLNEKPPEHKNSVSMRALSQPQRLHPKHQGLGFRVKVKGLGFRGLGFKV